MSSEAITRNDLMAILNEVLPKSESPQTIYIPSSQFSFESGYGSGTLGGDGLRIAIFNGMVTFWGQITASSFTAGSGTPRIRVARPSELAPNKLYSPVGIHRSGAAGGGTLASSAYAFRDRIWIQTDDTYLHICSANFLGSRANGYMEFQIYGATFPLEFS